jgi:hypothetical protein
LCIGERGWIREQTNEVQANFFLSLDVVQTPSEDKSIRDPFAENWQNVLGFSFPYPNGLCPKKKSRETTL